MKQSIIRPFVGRADTADMKEVGGWEGCLQKDAALVPPDLPSVRGESCLNRAPER